MTSDRTSEQAFYGVSALVFAASSALTIVCAHPRRRWARCRCRRLDDVDGVDAAVLGSDAGDATARPFGGQAKRTWPADCSGGQGLLRRLDRIRNRHVSGGMALVAVEMQQPPLTRAVPVAAGVVVVIAGALQFTRGRRVTLRAAAAPGLRPAYVAWADEGNCLASRSTLGLHCSYCCAG